MNIKYDLVDKSYCYKCDNKSEVEKLNFLLTNTKGDFLNLGYKKNCTKFQGFNVCNKNTLEIFKFLDEIVVGDVNCVEGTYGGYYSMRKFASKLTQNLVLPVNKQGDFSETLGSETKLKYDENGILVEDIDYENTLLPQDKFYLGPTGGFVYEINDYEGKIYIDLDMRKQNDFDKWGRIYEVYEEDGIVYVHFTKKNGDNKDYDLFFGIKAMNFSYDLIKDFIKKEYNYSKRRNSLYEWYVYRLMSINVDHNKRLVIGAGFSKEDVQEQILLLDQHQNELEGFDMNIFKDLIDNKEFQKPLTQDISLAYKLSSNGIYNFLNKDLTHEDIRVGSFAGFPWFANIWTRDELVGLRAFINLGEEELVKDQLYNYLNLVDYNDGLIKRVQQEGSLKSADGCFWLAKRFGDFIFYLEKEGRLSKVLTTGELKIIYDKFYLIFTKLTEHFWDSQEELLKVKKGDSWMDTVDVNYPIDIQVQFLEFVSLLGVLAQVLQREDEKIHLVEFENLLKMKVKNSYFRGGCLYDEPFEDKISCNVFLVYYFYPNLFTRSEWELIFDNALMHLRTGWGGISSISSKDSRFKESYTGEDNASYHNGDSWYWINNIAGIVLDDLNEKKYRRDIAKILQSSTHDILKLGSLGFASEVSSSSVQESHGCFAQLWSSSTYIEMVDKIFKR
ncbi:MAG: amylo-alpha-1,6-glucosidase [Nanoarchaeota archaeon]